jgi:hypothetical protein
MVDKPEMNGHADPHNIRQPEEKWLCHGETKITGFIILC